MFDLFAYWSTVTIISSPMLIVSGLIVAHFIHEVLFDSSRGRFKLKKAIGIEKFGEKLGQGIIPLVVFAILEAMLFLIIGFEHGFSLVYMVSEVAKVLSPSIGWLSSFFVALAVVWFVSRRVFDAYYLITDKLSKL